MPPECTICIQNKFSEGDPPPLHLPPPESVSPESEILTIFPQQLGTSAGYNSVLRQTRLRYNYTVHQEDRAMTAQVWAHAMTARVWAHAMTAQIWAHAMYYNVVAKHHIIYHYTPHIIV